MSNQKGSPLTEANSHRISRRGLLKAGTGVTLSALAVPTLSSTAIAHFPEKLDIDVNPDSDSNEIELDSRGVVSVAVSQTDEFDPTSEAVRYRFGSPKAVADGGGACPIHDGHVEDSDGDGSDDLLLHFPIRDTGFDGSETEAELRWEKDESGEHGLSGRDSVQIVGGQERSEEDSSADEDDDHQHEHGNEQKDEEGC